MIVYAGYIPYLPISPAQYTSQRKKELKKTLNSLSEIRNDLYAVMPDTVVLIGPSDSMSPDAFSILYSDQYITNYKEIGDYESKREVFGDLELIQSIKESTYKYFPLRSPHAKELSYQFSFGVDVLMPIGKRYKIVPISYTMLDAKDHVRFGAILRDVFEDSQKRVAVIAIGNQSHSLTKNGPAPLNEAGKKYDSLVKKCVNDNNLFGLISVRSEQLNNIFECGHKQWLIMAGILQDMQIHPKLLSYEHPYGVGYLSASLWK